jgi:hypothetical protein
MKAIRTRYYGPTNTKGSKIVATDGDRNSISIGYPYGLNSDEGHELAAYLLMQKMGWTNELVGGGFQNDMYWTMVERLDRNAIPGYARFLTQPKIQQEYAA